jgi:hypothetical protein
MPSSAVVKAERAANCSYAQYVEVLSCVFDEEQLRTLRSHFFEARYPVVEVEHATRSDIRRGDGRTTRQSFRTSTKPIQMIDKTGIPWSRRLQLEHQLKAVDAHGVLAARGEAEEALVTLRALRYFEKYPRAIGGHLPPWDTCLGAEMVDLSGDDISVEDVIIEVLLTKVVKVEPSEAAPEVKLEQGVHAQASGPPAHFEGTKVRKFFRGYGFWDGIVRRAIAKAGQSAKYEVLWHDGSSATMTADNVLRFSELYTEHRRVTGDQGS